MSSCSVCMVSGKQDFNYNETHMYECFYGACTPCCADELAKTWQGERDACINGDTDISIAKGCRARVVHLAGAVGDVATCLLCCPAVCVSCSFVSCLAASCSGVLWCVEKCCYSGNEKAHTSTVRAANAAKDCFANGLCFSSGAVCIGAKAVVCCPSNCISPAAADAWCFQQECNYALYKMTRWNGNYKELFEDPKPAS